MSIPENAERITEHAHLREVTDAFNAAADAAQDAQLTLERLQRKLAIQYELRGADTIDQFGVITRGA